MINKSTTSNINEDSSKGTSPLNPRNESSPISKTKLKQYGQNSLGPIVDLLHKYKDKFDPYMSALEKGLVSASDSLASSNSNSEKVVEGWFREASGWFSSAREKMNTENPQDLLNYFEEQARIRPLLMFAVSFESGMLLGRLGRYAKSIKSQSSMQTSYQH